jgi:hypothetical protein
MVRFFACTAALALRSGPWIRSASLQELRKSRTKAHSATWYGVIQKTWIHGPSLLEVRGGYSETRCRLRFVCHSHRPSPKTNKAKFNHVNGLQLIARAHQLVNEGYKVRLPSTAHPHRDQANIHSTISKTKTLLQSGLRPTIVIAVATSHLS